VLGGATGPIDFVYEMPRDAILYGILFGFTQRQPIEKDTFDNVDYWYGVCLKHN